MSNLFDEHTITKKTVENIAIFEFEYPYVYITFTHANIVDDKNLEVFFDTWLDIYNEKKPYIIIFDGNKIDYAKPTFVYKFTKFMKKLRKQTPQYLQYSIIIINNSLMRGLMNMVFKIQPPVAPVYLCEDAEKLEELHYKIHNKTAPTINISNKVSVSEEDIKKVYFDNNYKNEQI